MLTTEERWKPLQMMLWIMASFSTTASSGKKNISYAHYVHQPYPCALNWKKNCEHPGNGSFLTVRKKLGTQLVTKWCLWIMTAVPFKIAKANLYFFSDTWVTARPITNPRVTHWIMHTHKANIGGLQEEVSWHGEEEHPWVTLAITPMCPCGRAPVMATADASRSCSSSPFV